MSLPAVMLRPARSCVLMRRTARTAVLVEAAGIEPAPKVGLTADEPGRFTSGESRHEAALAATQSAQDAGLASRADKDAILQRFWSKVDRSGGSDSCWPWLGALGDGYGFFSLYCAMVRAHRFAFEAMRGPIPAGLVLDHTCRNRRCVNPAHLEPVTNRENLLRGQHPNIVAHREGRCRRGHSIPDSGRTKKRECRECARLRDAARKTGGAS